MTYEGTAVGGTYGGVQQVCRWVRTVYGRSVLDGVRRYSCTTGEQEPRCSVTSAPSEAVAEGSWRGIMLGDALARAQHGHVKATGDPPTKLRRILNVFICRVPVGSHRLMWARASASPTSMPARGPPPRQPTGLADGSASPCSSGLYSRSVRQVCTAGPVPNGT